MQNPQPIVVEEMPEWEVDITLAGIAYLIIKSEVYGSLG